MVQIKWMHSFRPKRPMQTIQSQSATSTCLLGRRNALTIVQCTRAKIVTKSRIYTKPSDELIGLIASCNRNLYMRRYSIDGGVTSTLGGAGGGGCVAGHTVMQIDRL